MRRFSARLRRCRFSWFTAITSSTVPPQHLRVHVDDRLDLLSCDRRPSAYAYISIDSIGFQTTIGGRNSRSSMKKTLIALTLALSLTVSAFPTSLPSSAHHT